MERAVAFGIIGGLVIVGGALVIKSAYDSYKEEEAIYDDIMETLRKTSERLKKEHGMS